MATSRATSSRVRQGISCPGPGRTNDRRRVLFSFPCRPSNASVHCASPSLSNLQVGPIDVPVMVRPGSFVCPARDAGLPVIRSIDEVVRRFPKGIPELDPVEDMKITEKGFAKLLRQIESAETDLAAHPYHDSAVKDDPDMRAQWDAFIKKRAADKDISILKKEVENLSKTSLFASNFKAMKRVLRRLGFITKENVVDTKGRVACCISTADELLATELIFSGVFNELSTEHVVALVSCLVYTEKVCCHGYVCRKRLLMWNAVRVTRTCTWKSRLLRR